MTGTASKRSTIERRIGLAILAIVVLASVLVPLLSSHTSDELAGPPFHPPSAEFPFGTDSAGRDLFVRVWLAGRLDLGLALLIVGISLLVGTSIGAFAGSSRHRFTDSALMRIVDAVVAFPFIVLVLALLAVIGSAKSLWVLPAGAPAILLAVLLVDWAVYARVARGQTLALRERDHVVAASLLGFGQRRIVFRHLMPGVVRVTAAYAVADLILMIIVIASLSFLGAGIQPPTPEWGAIMFEGRTVLGTSWWISVIPGLVLAFAGTGISLVADSFLAGRRR